MNGTKVKLSTKSLVITGWWLPVAAFQCVVMRSYEVPLKESILDSAVSGTMLALGIYAMTTIVKYFTPSAKNLVYVLIEGIALAGIACFLIKQIMLNMSDDQNYLVELNKTFLIRFLIMWLLLVIAAVQGWAWSYMIEQQRNEERAKETDRLMRDAELASLRQQLQPHFLFNSLNSISALTITQPEQARKMIEQLSDFLRGCVKKDSNQMVSLSDELHHLQLYLDIEKVRFGHRLTTRISADESLLEMKLPSLLLQPVLENAIKFGLYDTTGEVVISLDAKAEQNSLLIEIKNPFDPETAQARPGTGFGLSSVQRRLNLLFYRNDLLSTTQKENTFTTTIRIPQGSKT